jgi:hypothetical protein
MSWAGADAPVDPRRSAARQRRCLPALSLAGKPARQFEKHVPVGPTEAAGQVSELPGLGVLFGDVLQAQLFGLQKGVVLVEGRMVKELASGHPKGIGDSFYDIGGGVLATLLDVAQIALGHARFIGKRLQGEVPVASQPTDG